MTILRWTLPMLLGAATLASGCGTGQASAPASGQADVLPVPVEVALPHRGDIHATYAVTTTLESDADAPVPARVGGEVIEILVEEGDVIAAGQPLARLDGERQRLEMLAARANLERARGEYERYVDLHSRGLVSASMFEGLRYDLAALEATWQLRKLEHEYSTLRAPIGGVVAARSIMPGQTLAVGDEAFRITATAELLADLAIPQTELEKFASGHEAMLQVDSMPEHSFTARIVRISPTIDAETGTFRATAAIDNTAGLLAPGMFARFTIAYATHEDVLLVPSGALLDEDSQTIVYVLDDNRVVRRRVETGLRARGMVEVLSGLSDGESVVVVGHGGLRDGSRVLASTVPVDRLTG